MQNNGGPTQTHALLSGSFAIDKGHSSGSATDQRGFVRVVDNPAIPNATDGDGGDIGAFESGGVRILDIDANNNYDALTDGLLIIRYLFGLTGAALTDGAIGTLPMRSLPTEIVQYLDSIRPALDVDGNGQEDALTDGLMLIRYLSGRRGSDLTTGAVGTGATRTAPQIETFIQSLTP